MQTENSLEIRNFPKNCKFQISSQIVASDGPHGL